MRSWRKLTSDLTHALGHQVLNGSGIMAQFAEDLLAMLTHQRRRLGLFLGQIIELHRPADEL